MLMISGMPYDEEPRFPNTVRSSGNGAYAGLRQAPPMEVSVSTVRYTRIALLDIPIPRKSISTCTRTLQRQDSRASRTNMRQSPQWRDRAHQAHDEPCGDASFGEVHHVEAIQASEPANRQGVSQAVVSEPV